MSHPLDRLITATGLRRAAMFHDVSNVLHRMRLTGSDCELEALPHEQVLMALILTNQGPETPAWASAERILGRELPKE
jgi:hypothetical protein